MKKGLITAAGLGLLVAITFGVLQVLDIKVPLNAPGGDVFLAETANGLPNEMAQVAEAAKVRPRENGSTAKNGSVGQDTAKSSDSVDSGPIDAVSSPDITPVEELPAPPSTPAPTPTVSPPTTPAPTPDVVPETPLPTPEATPAPTSPPGSGSGVVINEIAWMGTDASYTDEWIELYNSGSDAVSLEGWALRADDGAPTIYLSGQIAAGGYYLIERTNDDTVSDISGDYVGSFGKSGTLKNDGELLRLFDDSGAIIDKVDCSGGWFVGTNSPKMTMERVDAGTDGSLASNWVTNDGVIRSGTDADGGAINGTPRGKNSVSP